MGDREMYLIITESKQLHFALCSYNNKQIDDNKTIRQLSYTYCGQSLEQEK